jgi:hypothetical protein
MAARIQANINISKERKRVTSVTVEHSKQLSPELLSLSRPQQRELAQQDGSPDISELPPPRSEQRRDLSAEIVGPKPRVVINRSRSIARSDGTLAHHKASLVEVVDVLVKDAVLGLCLLYKLKPAPNQHRILA